MSEEQKKLESEEQNQQDEIDIWALWDDKCWKCENNLKIAMRVSLWLWGKIPHTVSVDAAYCPNEPISPKIKSVLESKGCHLDMRYSKTIGASYIANFCPSCNSIQGAFFLEDAFLDVMWFAIEYLVFRNGEIVMDTISDRDDIDKKLNDYFRKNGINFYWDYEINNDKV